MRAAVPAHLAGLPALQSSIAGNLDMLEVLLGVCTKLRHLTVPGHRAWARPWSSKGGPLLLLRRHSHGKKEGCPCQLLQLILSFMLNIPGSLCLYATASLSLILPGAQPRQFLDTALRSAAQEGTHFPAQILSAAAPCQSCFSECWVYSQISFAPVNPDISQELRHNENMLTE